MLWLTPFGAAAACWILGFPVYRTLNRLNIIDKPNERSSHATPVVRGGGIAIMLVVVGGLLAFGFTYKEPVLLVLALCSLLLAIVSFVDDMRSISARIRFGCHAASAVALLAILYPRFPSTGFDLAGFSIPASLLLLAAFLWITGYTNAFNFMDGINGISGLQGAITGVGTAILSGLASSSGFADPIISASLLVAGASLGFLPHNFPKARMFMGDVSSAPLGFLLSGLGLWCAARNGLWLLPAIFALHANYILDTGITLIRRVSRGEEWHQPHREHFYQRLIRAGKSHAFVSGAEAVLQLGTVAILCAYVQGGPLVKSGCLVAILSLWSAFFAFAERLFVQHQQQVKQP